jgi:hypothetical protein
MKINIASVFGKRGYVASATRRNNAAIAQQIPIGGNRMAEPRYRLVGDGKLAFEGGHDAGAPEGEGFAFVAPDRPGAFRVRVGDLVTAMPGLGIVLPFEVIAVQGNTSRCTLKLGDNVSRGTT